MLPIIFGAIPEDGGGGVPSSREAADSPLPGPILPARACRLLAPRLSERDDLGGPRRAQGGGGTPLPANC